MTDLVFEPLPILRVLVEHAVEFVVIGGVAGNLLGSTTVTRDLDVMYRQGGANLERLAAALAELDARPRGLQPGLPFRLDAQALRNGSNFTLVTRYGSFDCLGEASGRFTFESIAPTAESLAVAGLPIRVASLDDLIRMKRAAGRNKDLIEVENLAALRDVREDIERRQRDE